MKFSKPAQWTSSAARIFGAAICLAPSLLFAHPGHYHPDETDEFEFLRATFCHSHGAMDYLLAATAISCIVLSLFQGRPAIRITAILTALGSLALIPIF